MVFNIPLMIINLGLYLCQLNLMYMGFRGLTCWFILGAIALTGALYTRFKQNRHSGNLYPTELYDSAMDSRASDISLPQSDKRSCPAVALISYESNQEIVSGENRDTFINGNFEKLLNEHNKFILSKKNKEREEWAYILFGLHFDFYSTCTNYYKMGDKDSITMRVADTLLASFELDLKTILYRIYIDFGFIKSRFKTYVYNEMSLVGCLWNLLEKLTHAKRVIDPAMLACLQQLMFNQMPVFEEMDDIIRFLMADTMPMLEKQNYIEKLLIMLDRMVCDICKSIDAIIFPDINDENHSTNTFLNNSL